MPTGEGLLVEGMELSELFDPYEKPENILPRKEFSFLIEITSDSGAELFDCVSYLILSDLL